MKILHICQSYPPMVSGQSFMVERLARGALQLGHEVMVISASDKKNPYKSVKKGIHLVRLKSLPNPFRVGQRFSALGVLEIKETLENFRPDVVHLHDLTNVSLAGMALAQSMGIPVLITMHGMPWLVSAYFSKLKLPAVSQTLENISWAYIRQAIRACNMIVAPSRTAAREIHKHVGKKALVVSNGVDLDRFHNAPLMQKEDLTLRKKYGVPVGVPIILHVGRLDGEKNVAAVVRSVALAFQKNKEAYFLIAGDGVERPELELLAKKQGIAPRSRFLGYVDAQKELPKLFRLARVFVTASEMESQGLVLLEAVASGLPIVAVKAGAVPDLVQHGKSGSLLRSGDGRGMAKALLKLLEDDAAARSFSRQARKIAQQHAVARTFQKYDALYRSIARSR